MKTPQVFKTILSALLVFLFVYTATDKLFNIDKNIFIYSQLPLIKNFASLIAIGIPAVEIIITILLVLSATHTKGLLAALVLMSMFTVYLAAMLLSNIPLPCTCGGIIQHMSWQQHLLFNITIIILIIIALNIKSPSLISHNLSR